MVQVQDSRGSGAGGKAGEEIEVHLGGWANILGRGIDWKIQRFCVSMSDSFVIINFTVAPAGYISISLKAIVIRWMT